MIRAARNRSPPKARMIAIASGRYFTTTSFGPSVTRSCRSASFFCNLSERCLSSAILLWLSVLCRSKRCLTRTRGATIGDDSTFTSERCASNTLQVSAAFGGGWVVVPHGDRVMLWARFERSSISLRATAVDGSIGPPYELCVPFEYRCSRAKYSLCTL